MLKTYRVVYRIWRLNSPDAESAKKEICGLLKKSPEKFVSVEEATDKRPLWKQFLLG